MAEQNMTALQKIDAINAVLDKLVDAHGRAKAGYIWAITDIVENLRTDVIVMEDRIKDLQNGSKSEQGG